MNIVIIYMVAFFSLSFSSSAIADCLDLQTNDQIARCAENMKHGGKVTQNRPLQLQADPDEKKVPIPSPALSTVVKKDPKINYVVTSKELSPGEIANQEQYRAARARLDAEWENQRIKDDIKTRALVQEYDRRIAQEAYAREIALRQQEIDAINRQAAAAEDAAEAAWAMARRAPVQQQTRQAPVIDNRPWHCNLNNGWCDR